MTHRLYADLARSSKVPPLHYLVIEVDPVAEEDRYVIVRRTLNEKERFADGFAVPLRHGDRTVYLLSEDTYRLINDGLRGRTIRDDRAIPAPGDLISEADERMVALEGLEDWHDTPVLFWQSIPQSPVQVVPDFTGTPGFGAASWDWVRSPRRS